MISKINQSHVYDKRYKKKKHLLFFKDLLVEELTDKVAEMEPAPKRKSPLSVAAVERLVPQSHSIMLVKDNRNCRRCSGTLKHTSTECAPCTDRHEYRKYWQVVPQFFILFTFYLPAAQNRKKVFFSLVTFQNVFQETERNVLLA